MRGQQVSVPEWSLRIQKLLSSLKLTQAGLAERLGVSPATVSRWMKGSHEPTGETYVGLGNLAGSPEGIYFWERAGMELSTLRDSKLRVALSSLQVNLKDFNLVVGPKLSRQIVANQASAVIIPLLNLTAYGNGTSSRSNNISLSQAEVEEVLMAPLSWCPQPDAMISMHVSGDFMAPVIQENAIIVVNTAVTERPKLHRKIAVFSHRNLGFKVARFQRLSSSDVLVGANDRHAPVDVSDASKWKVVGEVLWWVSKDR